MINILKQKDREELDKRLPTMPWYIEKFINFKLPDLSPSSLVEYMRDYETFLNWLMAEGLSEARSIKDVQLLELEKLHMDSIDGFRMYLSTYKEERNSKTTISRKLSSLRSLFHYLSQIAEDEEFYPLLKRNVMAKVTIKRTHKPKDTAAKLEGKLLQEEEITEFMTYIKQHYGTEVASNKQALYAYDLNMIRDACIISFILHSGLRVSELVNLNVDDIDLKKDFVMYTAKVKMMITLKHQYTFAKKQLKIYRLILHFARFAIRRQSERRHCF